MPRLPGYASALLNVIAGPESAGRYDVIYGGKRFDDFSDHPRIAVPIRNGPNAGKTSSAAGKYQFLGSTWDQYRNKLGLPDFSPQSQDMAAYALASDTYKAKTGRSLDATLQSGDPTQIAQVGKVLNPIWTSLPGGIEAGTNTNRFVSEFTKQISGKAPTTPSAGMDLGGTPMADAGPKQSNAIGGLGGLGGFVPPERNDGFDTGGLLRALGAALIAGDASVIPQMIQLSQDQRDKAYERKYGQARDDWQFGIQREDRLADRAERAEDRDLNRSFQQAQFQYQQGRDARDDTFRDRSLTIQEREAARLAQGYRIINDPAERAKLGIPADDNRPYQVSPQGQITAVGGVGQAQTPGVEARQREQLATQYGIDPNSAEGQRFILTGSLPSSDKGVTAGDREAIRDADDMVQNGEATMGLLDQAMKLSGEAYEGPLAGTRATIGSVFGAEGANATREYDNIVTEQALGQLKSIFGGAPTEGERAILLEIQGSSSQPKAVRDKILQRARAAVERRVLYNRDRANELRGGTYYKPREASGSSAPAAPPPPAATGPAPRGIDDLLKKYGS